MENFRRVEILRDNEWVVSEFADIIKDDIFRMFEPDSGELVRDNHGKTKFKAVSDVYKHPEPKYNEVLTVSVDDAFEMSE